MRDCFDARLSHVIYQIDDVDQLLRVVSRVPDRVDAVERLLELLPEETPYRAKLLKLLE